MNFGYHYELAVVRIILIALFNRLSDFFEGNLTNRFLSLVVGQSVLISSIFILISHTLEASLKFKLKRKAVLLTFLLVCAQGMKFIARAYRYNSGRPLYETGLLQTLFFALLPLYKIYSENLPSKFTNNLIISCGYHSFIFTT